MSFFLKENGERLALYKSSLGPIVLTLFVAFTSLGMGAAFSFYVAPEAKSQIFLYFGYFFMGVGTLVLIQSVSFFSRLKREGGALVFDCLEKGLRLAPGAGNLIYEYPWIHIKKVSFVDQLFISDMEGTSQHKDQILFWFGGPGFGTPGLVENSKHQRSKTDSGELYTALDCPRDKRDNFRAVFENREITVDIRERLDL